MVVTEIKRKFQIKINGTLITLEDPNDEMTPEEVKDSYSNHYPQLLNAKIEEKGIVDGYSVYEFVTISGVKG